MMRAMVAGAREPVHLARGRAPRWARRTEASAQAWTGHDHPAPGLALTPGRALDAVSTEPGRECAAAIARRFRAITPGGPEARPPLNRAHTPRPHHQHAPDADARGVLDHRTGVDLGAMPGLQASTVPPILADLGLDPWPWPHATAVCSWLGVAPPMRSPGGRSDAGARGGPAIAPATPFGARRPLTSGPGSATARIGAKEPRRVA
jgi:hypothetical protein